MAKLFLFGIGGTGARVIKHLVFLAAAGVKFDSNDSDTIIPIIIDPDNSNGDLNKTIRLIKLYNRIRNNVEHTDNNFFRLKLKNIQTFAGDIDGLKTLITIEENSFHQTIQDIQNKNLKDFLNLNTMTESSQALLRLLFSEDNLETNLEVGFKGNPNIGSIVLNQFSDAEYFKLFASSFNSSDRIFIISSIFGGTGASGFPTLLKNLRNPDEKIPNHNYIKDAVIGAISVLPYFNLENTESSKINSNTFISKTKSALEYYYNNIIHTKQLNSIYYIGYTNGATYENSEGGRTQENKAHFIEFASALSIFDFMDTDFTTNEEVSKKEYSTASYSTSTPYLTLTCLSHKDRKKIQNELIQFFLMTRYFTDRLPKISNKKSPWFDETKINTNDPVYQDMKEFIELYYQYLREMAENHVAFKPFKIDEENKEEVFSSIESITPHKSSSLFSFRRMKDYESFDDILNKSSKELSKDISNFKRLISLMYRATAQIIQDKQLDYKG